MKEISMILKDHKPLIDPIIMERIWISQLPHEKDTWYGLMSIDRVKGITDTGGLTEGYLIFIPCLRREDLIENED